ncbi:porin family protein [Spirosoma koreense]
MKRIYGLLLTVLFLSTHTTLMAQHASLEWRVKGGLNLSYLAIDNPSIPNPALKPGFNLGVNVAYPIGENSFLQSGLALTRKGARQIGEAPIGFNSQYLMPGREATLTSNQLYLQLPIYWGYRITLAPTTRLVLTAGPYVAYGFGGKTQLTGDIIYGDMIDYSTVEQKTFGKDGLQPFDMGLGTGIGLELGETLLTLGYEWGLRNIGPNGDAYLPFYKNSYRNRNLSLSVEFKF